MLFEFNSKYASNIAIIDECGNQISYDDLNEMIVIYSSQFLQIKGLLLLECRNDLNTIISYLAALRSNCPVFLVGEGNEIAIKNILDTFGIMYIQKCGEKIQTNDDVKLDFQSELAVVLSTSGSTGTAKAIKLSKTNILSNAKAITEYLNLTSNDISPTTLPFNYSYGLSVINSHLFIGGTIVLNNFSVIDKEFWQYFDKYQCTGIAGVPHSYELMIRKGVFSKKIKSLRYATQAGGRLKTESIEKLIETSHHQGWEFFVMYGQTEATARMSYLPPDVANENINCIGIPIPNGSFKLIDESGNEVLDIDVEGELVYKGPNVMMGYALTDEDLLRSGTHKHLVTGDLACKNKNGLYYITGRKSRFIKCVGLRISLDTVESWLHEKLPECAVSSAEDNLVVFTTKNKQMDFIKNLVKDWLKIPIDFIFVQYIEKIPRLENKKVDYKTLNSLSSKIVKETKAKTQKLSVIPNKADKSKILSIFQNHFPKVEVKNTDSFKTIGGDSLNYVQVSLDLESVFSNLPQNWENMSISQLTALSTNNKTTSWLKPIEMQTLIRAVAIILVVCGHFDIWKYGGTGALTLLLIAGFNFGKFQIPQVISQRSILPIYDLLGKIVLLSIGYLLLVQLVFDSVDIPSLFFFSNYYGPDHNNGFMNWFLDIYVQILLFLSIVLSSPFVRTQLAVTSYFLALAFTIFTLSLMVVGPFIIDTSNLMNRVPHMMIWIFAMGVLINFSKTILEKSLTSICFIGAFSLYLPEEFYAKVLFYAGILLIWANYIPIRLPNWLRVGVSEVAAASLFIYLSHFQFRSLSEKVFGETPFAALTVAIIGGIIGWRIYARFLLFIPQLKKSVANKK